MNAEPRYISVVEPLSAAVERVKMVLFRPFDLSKWFVIGFCAWLAELGKGGGGGWGGGGHGQSSGHDVGQALHQAKQHIVANLAWIVPLAVVGLVVLTALWLLFTWLSSRGRFMFLHCVVENKAQVRLPWGRFARQAGSLFAFRIVLWLIGLVVMLPLIVAAVAFVVGLAAAGEPVVGLGLILVVLAMIVVGVIFALIKMFTSDFVVPVMFVRASDCTSAWREVLGLMGANKGRLVLYVLFKIVMALTIGMIVLMTVCLTCCCAGCIMAIPYIGTVLYLPILVFQRAYPLYYLRQYGNEYDVFGTQAAVSQVV
jgi:hypothetical protein